MSNPSQPVVSADHPAPGSHHYRAFIGPAQNYDLVAAMQFNLLTHLGLREQHTLLDIGCGSLRAGKLTIPYLLPGHYYGIEPEQWLLDEGIANEIGASQVELKRPTLINDRNFTLSAFKRSFDYLLAQSIFSHTSEAQIVRCLSEARQVMTPTSIFAATYVAGDSNYAGTAWVYPECVTYTPSHMSALAASQGLVCHPIRWTHPNGQSWVAIVRDDYAGNVQDLIGELPYLKAELQASRQRLERLERHPWVRVGRAGNALLYRLRRLAKRR
jgi:hypothetical protein